MFEKKKDLFEYNFYKILNMSKVKKDKFAHLKSYQPYEEGLDPKRIISNDQNQKFIDNLK